MTSRARRIRGNQIQFFTDDTDLPRGRLAEVNRMDLLIPQTLPDWPAPKAEDLIRYSVDAELSAYHQRYRVTAQLIWLDLPSLRKAIDMGKVNFGNSDVPLPEIDAAFARRAACEAFQDGIVLMLVDGKRIGRLSEILTLTPVSTVRYLKLSALSGT